MSEYVKKTPFGGYKEVQGGYSSSEWEYVILTRKEYNNQETELRVAKAGKSEAEEKARKNIDRANVEAKREINEAYKAADEQVEKIKQELAAANAAKAIRNNLKALIYLYYVVNQLNNLKMSLPKARTIRPKRSIMPTIWAYSRNLSLGFLPVIISYKVNRRCPPSKAGIGRMLSTASITERNAVRFQKICQFQVLGNIEPIVMKLPTDL